MDRDAMEQLDEYRSNYAGPIENSLIDDLASGEIDRGSFLRRASILGLSATTIGAALRAMGHASPAYGATALGQAGGRIRVGVIPGPTGDFEPHLFKDHGRLAIGRISGEFLLRSRQDFTLGPELAVSWRSNADATQWAFNLRRGVKFANGKAFTADDVIATFNRLTDPNGGSQALSAFQGVLSPGGAKKVGDYTVVFYLQAPNANFPYLVSSTTYQAIILPADYKIGTFAKTAQTTGPFNIVSYTPGVGAKYDRNPNWWGGKALLDGVDVTFYSDDAAVVAALLSGQIDLVSQVTFASDRALFNNSKVQILSASSAGHRQISMLTQTVAANKALKDYRVRQAIGMTLDRPKIIKQLFNGFGDPGNDAGPFAPVYPVTDKKLPQRHQDLAAAKKLLAKAGYPRGFKVTLTAPQFAEIPQLAQILSSSVKKIGIDMPLSLVTYDAYYAGTYSGGATGRGTNPWLNSPIDITDWAHRSVPNVVLGSAFKTGGVWNAADYSNKKIDALIGSFFGAVSLKDQKKYSAQIMKILQHDTPVIFPYFFKWNVAASKRVKGFQADALGLIDLGKTSLG
jgi:peptide/nickel transport system substrate-binding protein